MSDTNKETLKYKYLYIEDFLPNHPMEDKDEDKDDDRGVVVIDIFSTEIDSH